MRFFTASDFVQNDTMEMFHKKFPRSVRHGGRRKALGSAQASGASAYEAWPMWRTRRRFTRSVGTSTDRTCSWARSATLTRDELTGSQSTTHPFGDTRTPLDLYLWAGALKPSRREIKPWLRAGVLCSCLRRSESPLIYHTPFLLSMRLIVLSDAYVADFFSCPLGPCVGP